MSANISVLVPTFNGVAFIEQSLKQWLFGERPRRQAAQLRPDVLRGLHGGHERHLFLRAAPGLAAAALSIQVGIIGFDPAGKLAICFDRLSRAMDPGGSLHGFLSTSVRWLPWRIRPRPERPCVVSAARRVSGFEGSSVYPCAY